MGGKGDQGRIEGDCVAATLEHCALQIIVEHDLWNPAPSFEGFEVTGQKRFHPCIQKETQEDPARVAQDDDEGHEWAPRPANLQMSEVAPVRLGLFARKCPQAQISLGLGARPVAGDHVTEMAAVTAVSPLNDHAVKTGSSQAGKGLQGLKDEGR
ncbi:hypothetical protein NKI25_34455 [Mesorhizobium sp. M0808]|uniref:hypothetical protein n=1 Tax=Mesorhizobium sp. M0808 TaxID=2957002 RepID=UPI00333D716E